MLLEDGRIARERFVRFNRTSSPPVIVHGFFTYINIFPTICKTNVFRLFKGGPIRKK